VINYKLKTTQNKFQKGKTDFYRVSLMLLGSGRRLHLRRNIRDKLHKRYGYPLKNIIIMEDVNKDEKLIIRKFGDILDKYSPQLFFALFESKLDMSGVVFELGWLCGKYDTLETSKRIRIISDFEYQWKKTTGYLRALMHHAHHLPIEKMTASLISAYTSNNTTISLNIYRKT
jgi:hypothetical protein